MVVQVNPYIGKTDIECRKKHPVTLKKCIELAITSSAVENMLVVKAEIFAKRHIEKYTAILKNHLLKKHTN